ncbi:hypothetical protein GALMADRAFT_81162 [Galerina marginata CBS 339.88]|uniref:Integral membrane family protein n=1 Tax=Galerina marginata (strain CBS 339.88) TaxID=685588 RepID=A0A067S5U3_GALM3|nr:hypothetical protein GALMADRAFT_81162 [Galerina marginata CBS 339.88]
MQIPLVPLALASLLSGHGLRKHSLSPSGALAALVVGFLMMAGGTRVFGVTLIGFYLVGSRATKYGKNRKALLEDGYQEGGYRSAWQVLCNSASALVASVLWNAAFAPTSVQAAGARLLGVDVAALVLHLNNTTPYDTSDKGWCPASTTVADGWSRALMFASLGHFACCLGDTLASELGILSRSRPRLITTLKAVPPGTNGAMSFGGTVASIVGGGVVGTLVGVTLVLENAKCSEGWSHILFESVCWGMCWGGFGSLVSPDSPWK